MVGRLIHHRATHEGMESPVLEYTPHARPPRHVLSRISFSTVQGNFFFGCLVGNELFAS